MKRVLVLGAGLVVKPLLDELLAQPEIELHLATLNIARAQQLLAGRPRAVALESNAADQVRIRPEVDQADVVISLLPADQHVRIAEECLAQGVPLVTTSYISDGMRALDARARERGVLLLNEMGLDPGIDHMTAVQAIRRVRDEGGEVLSLHSYCGGIPAPESNNNPWGYKFTWSPRGVVLAVRNPVRYLEEGTVVERPFPQLFDDPRTLEVPGVGRLEAYPNRDCLRFLKPYGVETVHSFFRGTLRYPGWCETWHALFELGLLDLESRDWSGVTYAGFLGSHLPPGLGSVRERLAQRLKLPPGHAILGRLEWLGLLSQEPVPAGHASPLDVITDRLEQRLRYAPGERDLVVLEHRFVIRRRDGALRSITSRLVEFGVAGDDSAMARTVSLPAALAVRLILEDRVTLSGVHIPVDPQLVDPILRGLRERGLRVEEVEQALPPSAGQLP